MTSDLSPQSSEWMNAIEFARRLDCTPRHVYRLADAERIPQPETHEEAPRWSRAVVDAWFAAVCPDQPLLPSEKDGGEDGCHAHARVGMLQRDLQHAHASVGMAPALVSHETAEAYGVDNARAEPPRLAESSDATFGALLGGSRYILSNPRAALFLLTRREAAEKLGVSLETLDRQTHPNGMLRGVPMGTRMFYDPNDILTFVRAIHGEETAA